MLATQSCPDLCDPTDCSPPGSSLCGILQARMLELVAMSFSRGSSQPRDQTPCLLDLLHGRQILYHLSNLIKIKDTKLDHPVWGSRDLGDSSPLCASVSLTEKIRVLDWAPCDFCPEASSSRQAWVLLAAGGTAWEPQYRRPAPALPQPAFLSAPNLLSLLWVSLAPVQQSHHSAGQPRQLPAGQPWATSSSLCV